VGKEPRRGQQLADYVLEDFSEPKEEVLELIVRAADLAESWICAGGVPA
jgi:hypothetical protein